MHEISVHSENFDWLCRYVFQQKKYVNICPKKYAGMTKKKY